MKTTIERIEVGQLLRGDQIDRLGLEPRRLVRVIVETLDDGQAAVDPFASMSDDEVMALVDQEIAADRAERRAGKKVLSGGS